MIPRTKNSEKDADQFSYKNRKTTMNRMNKEIKRKYKEARQGLSKEEIAVLDRKEAIEKEIENMAHKIHIEKFPEEYDCMGDSILDAEERSRGINPMNQEYIEKIQKKREKLGVSQLSESGRRVSDDTFNLCRKEAKKLLEKNN